MKHIHLDTQRLHLRSMVSDDLDELLNIFGDPRVMASFNEPPFTRQQMQGWLDRNLAHQERWGYGLFAVILKAEEVLIGDCGLEHMDLEGEEVTELGYDICSAYWNQGYATEAARAVRDFAFQSLDLPKLVSLIRVGNQASKRVAEKTGMHFVDVIERYDIAYWKYAINRKE
ncbi:MAG: GNAT family N-acetyltransferase [Anaerolineales bacterium]